MEKAGTYYGSVSAYGRPRNSAAFSAVVSLAGGARSRFSAVIRRQKSAVRAEKLPAHRNYVVEAKAKPLGASVVPHIWAYIDKRLVQLGNSSKTEPVESAYAVPPEALKLMRRFLNTVCDSSSVYPHIAPDGEGGISAIWHADRRMVEILVDEDRSVWAITRDGERVDTFQLSGQDEILEARRCLSDLSALVYKKNPGWRELFRER